MTYLDGLPVVSDGNAGRTVKATKTRSETNGERIVRRLRGSATTQMTTDEILALTRGED